MKATRYITTIFAGALLLSTAVPAQGQIDDVRWLPFIGCWQLVGSGAEGELLCFQPTTAGVEMTSYASGEPVATETLIADGQARTIVAEGCDGLESVSFSADGSRAFTRSEIICGDDPRSGTGVMALIEPMRWIDVRALDVQGEKVGWTQEYSLVGLERLQQDGISDPTAGIEGSVRAARLLAARDIDLDDVTEAVETIDTEAVVTWIAAQRDRFELDADALVRLADIGVPDEVIDVVVAVSYPDRFVVAPERVVAQPEDVAAPMGRRIPLSVGYRGYGMWDPFMYGSYYGYGFRRSYYGYGYGYGYPYGYGGLGYGYGPYSGYGYGFGPTIVRVERRQPAGGRVVAGRGWTRSSGADTGRSARPSGGSGSSSGRAWAGSRGSAGSGGSGAARGSTGRRAKPRGGGS